MKASNQIIIEDEFEITDSTIEIYYSFEGDEEALPLSVDLDSFREYCESSRLLNFDYDEFNPVTQNLREWSTQVSFEELLEDIELRDYLRSLLNDYCPKIIAQLENKTAA